MRLRHVLAALFVLLLTWSTALGQAQSGVVNRDANLRAGPGTTYAVTGAAKAGQAVTIAGANAGSAWYQLDNGNWIAAFLVDVQTPPASPPQGTPAQVTHIVDGDTIDVTLDGQTVRVRYILINTPERGQPFADEATAANRALVEGQTVYLLKDVSETDRYDRLLRYVYLANGLFVNAELVRQGMAQLSTFPPDVAKESEIRAAQQEAIAGGRGLWADTPATATAANPATANRNANLRSGPGTNYAVAGQVAAGATVVAVGRNAAGDWLKLESGAWIAAFLVDDAPTNLTVVDAGTASPSASAASPTAAPTPTPLPAQPAVNAPPERACHPSYDPCVSIASDADCAGGRGNGPIYVEGPIRVIGPDVYDLDRDGDGIGCE